MVVNLKVVLGNTLLAFAFLVYLCILDFLFIFRMDEQKSIINDLGLLIAVMPFVGAFLTFRMTKACESFKARIATSLAFFMALAVIGFIEYLWVATHFHTLLGGKI